MSKINKIRKSMKRYKFDSKVVVTWKCEAGHFWNDSIYNRTVKGTNCPVCDSINAKVK